MKNRADRLITQERLVDAIDQFLKQREADSSVSKGAGRSRRHQQLLESVIRHAVALHAPRARRAAAEVRRLRRDCGEAYQVVGVLAGSGVSFNHPDVQRALDNLSAAAQGLPRPHDDLLPFIPSKRRGSKKPRFGLGAGLAARGIRPDVLLNAYDWTIDVNGNLCGLTAGDMHYEESGIVLSGEALKIWQQGCATWRAANTVDKG